MRQKLCALVSFRGAVRRLAAAGAAASILLCLPVSPVNAQDINYTFSGIIRVLDLSSPPPGSGAEIPGVDPLGMDGAAVLLSCVIDSTTVHSYTAATGDGIYAFYNAGSATLSITGSIGGGVDGTYVEIPCSVRVDDFPIGSTYGGDVLSITTTWDLGLPFPDVFQVPFARLAVDTFTGFHLQVFAASEVSGFIGVNFAGSNDAFYFDVGAGIAAGNWVVLSPAQHIEELIDDIAGLPGLNRGQKRALTAKLDNALRMLERGNERPAVRILRAFVNNVEALIRSGRLALEDGQPLIDEANAVIDQILTG